MQNHFFPAFIFLLLDYFEAKRQDFIVFDRISDAKVEVQEE